MDSRHQALAWCLVMLVSFVQYVVCTPTRFDRGYPCLRAIRGQGVERNVSFFEKDRELDSLPPRSACMHSSTFGNMFPGKYGTYHTG
ncbi:hypothetical protein K504DRAFT_137661 [Pleomassaria siparia CBS 279.74]|uniref:Secreted protein n=1 Tax=Pleomassaria siparia CBS 279.74 TaxID=1314801 RepID=A0A6G1KKR5_9PLEO|nr:hypothetical protein K504DRAFT_137661 [Pleomassaria siparia CBS 279.74]